MRTRLCAVADLPRSRALRVELPGLPAGAVAVAQIHGQVCAIADECSHATYPLSDGRLKGHRIECDLHGSWFDLRTGHPDRPPAWQPVPVYPVAVVDGDIYIEI